LRSGLLVLLLLLVLVSPRIRKRGFLVERRFASESSASSPKRSGGLSSRTCRRSCFVHDAAMRANRSSASALIAIADSATAAIFAGNKDRRFGFEGKFIENAKE
jgi:hypothetical protein